ncbi:MAG: macrocin O-methyltransferase [Rhodothermaceae bacterium]|nr:macrocin O-methyltransferase [Rhodothermaceae bacterium]
MLKKRPLARRIKVALLRSGAARAAAPTSGTLLKAGYLARLAEWAHSHRELPFSADHEEPDFRYDKRERLYAYVLDAERLNEPIDYLEFGVAGGQSFTWWLNHNTDLASRFVGFDTFTGLPEDFGPIKAGAFSTQGQVPDVDDPRARFIAGFFQDTLGLFLAESDLTARPAGRRLVIHLDADLYSSTLFVLTRLAPVLRSGDVLLFDEFGVPMHEFKAFTEFVHAYGIRYTVLGQANDFLQLALKLT